ncbi:iron complex outermembrane receptor protein [Caulobacter ginsengisoli]|uniref:Iron complex outermembrane receptor protein n=1 Tax=Caulobacter ginsengisoli TaxID=400775 RepID=A0ABU0IUM2_9CAUL|nr:TonB-dependent receptor [Caulobacter ginsengisoli]MDQ0464833.1 iron complex outermembrane receptor protein [Caulobacter ginsengisoli]
MNKQILMAGVAAGLALAASAAQAQSVDYGSLQQLFDEPVTTSATGSPQRSTEAPADMQIISQDEIRRSGETSIPGILQRVAGIDVLNFSVGQSDVNVRGYDQISSPRLLVLINGRQVYLDHYGLTIWQTLPVQLSEIRQIEVVKGPNSALFGFNAVSGVINIITFNPKFDDLDVASVRVGDHGFRDYSLATTFKLGEAISARVSGGSRQQDEWARTGPLPLASDVTDPNTVQAAIDVVAQLNPKTDLRVEGSWSSSHQDGLAVNTYTTDKMITTSIKATLTADTDFGLIQVQGYQNGLTAKYPFALWNNTITVFSAQDLFKIGADNTIRLGAEYRHNTLNTAPLTGGEVSYDVYSASGMWNWAITEQLTTTAALRVDSLKLKREGTFPNRIPLDDNSNWDRTITKPSVNLTAAWRPTANDTFRLSYAQGVQTPSLIELGGVQLASTPFPGFTIDIMGNPNLKPSIVSNYELAYDRQFSAAKIGVRLFEQDWKDIKSGTDTSGLVLPPTATHNAAIYYINASDSKMKGLELTASGSFLPGFNWRADTTYTDVKDSPFAGVNVTKKYVAFQSTTPKFRGNIGLDWTKGPWEADANLHYVSEFKFYSMAAVTLEPVKAYASLSARLGYRWDNGLALALSGQNLLKERQEQTRGLEAERRVQVSLSKSW